MKTASQAMKYEVYPKKLRVRTKTTKLVEKNVFEPLTTYSIIMGGSKELILRAFKYLKKHNSILWIAGFWIELAVIVWIKLGK